MQGQVKVKHNGVWVPVSTIVAVKEGLYVEDPAVQQKLDAINGEVIPGGNAAKADKTAETKQNIANAIAAKGVPVPSSVKFSDYPSKIAAIEQGGGTAINNQNKSVTIKSNGTQTVSADSGFTGLGSVTIKTEVPASSAQPKTEEKAVTITTNGQTIVEKSPSVDGMTKVTIDVNVPASGGGGSASPAAVDFGELGYSRKPQILMNELAKSKNLLSQWNPKTVHNETFKNANVKFAPTLRSEGGDQRALFLQNKNIIIAGDLFFEQSESVDKIFQDCANLKEVGEMHFEAARYIGMIFSGCKNLERVKSISLKGSQAAIKSTFAGCVALRYCVIKDLGTLQNNGGIDMHDCAVWGVNDDANPDARQSLIDSLITYSFDRASAGFASVPIILSAQTYALLTPEEIQQIAAKGFTVTDQVSA